MVVTKRDRLARPLPDARGQFGLERRWAVEDCPPSGARPTGRRRADRAGAEADGSHTQVGPNLWPEVRPIDALAVARAAQREPDLPVVRLDGPDRELRLLVDHRESLVAERTPLIRRLR